VAVILQLYVKAVHAGIDADGMAMRLFKIEKSFQTAGKHVFAGKRDCKKHLSHVHPNNKGGRSKSGHPDDSLAMFHLG